MSITKNWRVAVFAAFAALACFLGGVYLQAVSSIYRTTSLTKDSTGKIRVDRTSNRFQDRNHSRFNNLYSDSCQAIVGSASATLWWAQNIDSIVAASQLEEDPDFTLRKVVLEVLKLITPRLPDAVKSVPQGDQKLQVLRVVRKFYNRFVYLKQQQGLGHVEKSNGDSMNQTKEPKLHPDPVLVIVYGGSVTCGSGCPTLHAKPGMPKFPDQLYDSLGCAWPNRLEQLFNNFFGVGKIVEVRNLCKGGTSTFAAMYSLLNDIKPYHFRHPDIIINAYSTNDVKKAANVLLASQQAFVRSVLQWNPPCSRAPLLVFMDEYFGGRGILEKVTDATLVRQTISLLSGYYGFAWVSYADAVRDLVYSNLFKDYWLSPPWNEHSRGLHPGAIAHQAMAYVAAHFLMHVAHLSCVFEPWDIAAYDRTMLYNATSVPGLPGVSDGDFAVSALLLGRPNPRPVTIPPSINDNLTVDFITQEWAQEEENFLLDNFGNISSSIREAKELCYAIKDGRSKAVGTFLPQCPFSFLYSSNLEYLDKELDNILAHVPPITGGAKQTNDLAEKYKNLSWRLTNDHYKYGWMPVNASRIPFILQFENFKDIKVVHFIYLQSYGALWNQSEVTVTLSDISGMRGSSPLSNASKVEVVKLHGYHDEATSESNVASHWLQHPSKGIQIEMALTGGQIFKLSGLSICTE